VNWTISISAAVFSCFIVLSSGTSATQRPTIDVRQPTIVAFFSPVTQAELSDGETNEALDDFQYYAGQVRAPLRNAGIKLHEIYAHSFQIRIGKKITVFHPVKAEVGYYFAVPGKKPRVEYGVLTDVDLLNIAHEYFGTATK
jgi:hypothetical protein